MAKVVPIIDSATGTMIDTNGRGREKARYRKFASRMLSLDTPTTILDYGANGATKLEVSSGGNAGEEISLKADVVNISNSNPSSPAVLKVNGRTLSEIIGSAKEGDASLDHIRGKTGEISVEYVQNPDQPSDPFDQILQISLDKTIIEKIDEVNKAIEDFSPDGYVRKEELAEVVRDIEFNDDYDLEDVKAMLRVLVKRISDLAGAGGEGEETDTSNSY